MLSEDNFNFRASDVEFGMPKPSYTIDTLAYLTDQYPQHQFCLFLGSDNLVQLKRWKNYQTILDNYEIFVYPGPGDSNSFDHPNIKLIDAPLLDISATLYRKSILAGNSFKYLLPDGVANYIRELKLHL
ncbi:nicotinic acid mononucleotide adenylyltransferase [Algoriphagus sp. D3-2-R+10]|uniref:nicotinate-nicotinamide nucleotide adenylyltransferase n=1 Tax=Algoriphagus aurantiacus TaxID=3103948 RepID=UPI002B365964|nr:nicotinic acid mononucleotide adenylyltransferase [Algoriphagus sp. D3-2-R+10]MEB2775670.1 nicotinic acid mononucleotide adenylyltransferase [Algoriphagus sp. D3-2-R+10]